MRGGWFGARLTLPMSRSRTVMMVWFFLMCGSHLSACPHVSPGTSDGSKRIRENKVAGLRPGQDTVAKAYKFFGRNPDEKVNSGQISWFDLCGSQRAVIAFDSNNVVQSITVEQRLVGAIVDCNDKVYSRSVRVKFGSGRGLFRWDRCERITEIYGTPDSRKVSDSDRKVYVYRYGRTDQLPMLTLEITCDTTENRVYSFTLAVSAK
jgi:hypothetical protein